MTYRKDIKLMAFVMSAMFWGSGYANDVYMEQIGDNSVISVTQTGAGNKVNGDVAGISATDPALIKGDNNVVTINQIGASNTLSLVLNNETNGGGATVIASADGSNNLQKIQCGTSLSSSCNASLIRSEITGNNNTTIQTLEGGVTSSKIAVNGNYNSVTHTASGVGLHSADITVSGSGTSSAANVVSVIQSGATAKNAIVTSNGSNNNISITQSDQ
jgi:hypothetical protein